MKRIQFLLIALLLASALETTAQTISDHSDRSMSIRGLEFGVKGGATFTHGFTNIPAQSVGGVQIPAVENKSNGIGVGYTGGLWARKNFNNFFLQAEVTYNRYVLKQKTSATVDVNANQTLANALPISVQSGLLNATLNIVSESVLQSVDVPILFGKRWMNGRLRGYVGPNFIFVQKADVSRITSGQINANSNVGFPQTTIPATSGTTDLRNKYVAQYLEVKDFTYALDLGAGYTLLNVLDIDVRYALPVGGIYKDTKITGFLGIATVSLGFKIL